MAQNAGLLSALGKAARPAAPKDVQEVPATTAKTSTRAGKVQIGVWVSPAYRSSLLQIRAQDSTRTQEDLILEALNDLFEKYHVPTVRD